MAGAANLTDGFFSPSCVFVNAKGKTRSSGEWKAENQKDMKSVSKIQKLHFTCSDVAVRGDRGTSKVRFHMAGLVKMGAKKMGRLVVDGDSREDLRRVGGKWVVTKDVQTGGRTTLNGKPVPM